MRRVIHRSYPGMARVGDTIGLRELIKSQAVIGRRSLSFQKPRRANRRVGAKQNRNRVEMSETKAP
jgi:hypothetical protein